MGYDGTTKIGNELAGLYQCSPKSGNIISKLMNEARAALSLGNSKRLTPIQNVAIWRYHCDKVNGRNIPAGSITDNDVNIPAHNDGNNPIKSAMNIPMGESPSDMIIPTDGGNSNIPTQPLKTNTKATDGVFKLINFSVKLSGGRTVISLEYYLVDALKSRFALADNTQVRQWIEAAMTDNFDPEQPTMRQIRFAIIQALIQR